MSPHQLELTFGGGIHVGNTMKNKNYINVLKNNLDYGLIRLLALPFGVIVLCFLLFTWFSIEYCKDYYLNYPNIFKKIEKNDIKEVEKLLYNDSSLVYSRDFISRTPLHLATLRENADIVILLIRHGADVNAVDKKGWTPLHYAVIKGNKKIYYTLIDYGADPCIKNKKGNTPGEMGTYNIFVNENKIRCKKEKHN